MVIITAGAGNVALAEPPPADRNPAEISASGQDKAATEESAIPTTRDGVVRENEATYWVQEGTAQRMTSNMRLRNGITVTPDGDLLLPDGRKATLFEGQTLTPEGDIVQTIPSPAERRRSMAPSRGDLQREPGQ
jgi:hypothetical protein